MTYIDYIFAQHLKDIMNCKTIPGEVVVSQRRLELVDLTTKKESRSRRQNQDRINGGDVSVKQ